MQFDASQMRLLVFLSGLVIFAVLETCFPDRSRNHRRIDRWGGIGLLLIAGSVLSRAIVPIAVYDAAGWAQDYGFGLLNLTSGIDPLLASVFGFLAMDFSIWLQHLLAHKIPIFWRLHRVHHTDIDLDTATALRFHPIEISISLGLKVALAVALGVPPMAAVVFEIALSTCAMFNHSNFKLPTAIEPFVRWIIVTPEMHRVHHSVKREENDTNFSTVFSFWDRLFGTYTKKFSEGENAPIGQDTYREKTAQGGFQLLTQPFKRDGS